MQAKLDQSLAGVPELRCARSLLRWSPQISSMPNEIVLYITPAIKCISISIDHMDLSAKIYVAGHTGLVGSALVRRLRELGFRNLVLRTHLELDLSDQRAVRSFLASEKPE